MEKTNYAAIDIGSNAVRLLIKSVEPVIHGDRKSQWAENSQYDKEKRADGVDD